MSHNHIPVNLGTRALKASPLPHDFQRQAASKPARPSIEFDAGLLTGFALALFVTVVLLAVLPLRGALLVLGMACVVAFVLFIGRFVYAGGY